MPFWVGTLVKFRGRKKSVLGTATTFYEPRKGDGFL